MEAETLKTKKQIKKGKLKKTIKNVICRPDPSFWPQTSEDEAKTLIEELNRLKVNIPEFKKPLWSELIQIPKELRPKPPPIPTVEGLIFGIAQCQKAIDSTDISGILIEAEVNPKSIVQPLIETCFDNSIPVLCMKELRSITKMNFGIRTIVLGVKKKYLSDLEKKILEISKSHKPRKEMPAVDISEEMDVINPTDIKEIKSEILRSPYLYRVSKSSRTFSPPIVAKMVVREKFGANYIKVSDNSQNKATVTTQYRKMFLKKISSNPNRKTNKS